MEHAHDPLTRLKSRLIWLGITLTVLGGLAVAAPWVPALAIDALVAVSLVAAGAAQLLAAAGTASWRGFWIAVLCGTLSVVAGTAMLAFPGEGVRALTMFVGLLLLFEAAAKLTAAFSLTAEFPWGWLLVDGLITACLAALLLMSRAEDSGVYLGTLVGINLVVSGGSFLGAGWWLKRQAI